MMINTKPLLSVFILLLTSVCDVFTSCNFGGSGRTVTSGFGYTYSTQFPSVQFVVDTYFTNKQLTDKCMTGKSVHFDKIKGSQLRVSGGSSPYFDKIYLGNNGEALNSASGKFFVSSSDSFPSYLSFNVGKSSTPNRKYPSKTGRLYFLRIEPAPRYNHETSSWTADKEVKYGGSVITYYMCLEDDRKTMDSAVILQTPIKRDTSRAVKNVDKSKNTNSLYIPSTAEPIKCY